MQHKPRGWILFLVLSLTAWLGANIRFAAAQTPPTPEPLSLQAQQQIGELEQEKASRTPLQRKLDSQFVYQLKQNRRESFAPSATQLRASIKYESDGRVMVDITANVTKDLLDQIISAGGTIISSVPQFNSVRAVVSLDQVEVIAASADVRFISRAIPARTRTGTVDSEGDTTHAAISGRSTYGVNGAGIKVGVISDSVRFLTNSQGSGNLPTNVIVLPGQSGTSAGDTNSSGEGTAMLEIVNDIAPGAQLYFATAEGGESVFAQNILNLRSNGCNIIVDDVGYFDESPFQDGVVTRAVNTVTADGALYFSAAGNGGNKDANSAGTWEGDFVDGGAAASPLVAGDGRVHSFSGTNYNTAVGTGGGMYVSLFWADPLGAATNDYDLYILGPAGTNVVGAGTNPQTGSQDPFELAQTAESNDRIVVARFAGTNRFLHVQVLSDGFGSIGFSTAGGVYGHPQATNAFAVGAVDIHTAYPGAFTGGAANPVQYFSSDGPRRIFFQPDGTSITPGNYSATGGRVLQKPDIAAANGVTTSLPGFAPFYGTSAAAPHAAALAALLLSYNPLLTAPQVRMILTNTALDINAAGVDRDSGAGIIMAPAILQCATTNTFIILASSALVSETCSNGAVDPGETVSLRYILRNNGVLTASNLVMTLLATNGVTSPSGPQTNTIAAGAYTTNIFSFSASATCGGNITATLQLKAGTASPPAINVPFTLGQLVTPTTFTQTFDGVTAPALPAGWTTATSGGQALWVTSAGSSDTAPNSAFTAGAATAGVNELVSPAISVISTNAQLTFHHSYNFQNNGTRTDGGVLEMQIGTNGFADVLAQGGTFASNPYTVTLSSTRSNPLGGRAAWSGNSSGFVVTTVNLPAAAAGQTVQFKWRCGTDTGTASTGWFVDSVTLAEAFYSCCTNFTPSADLAIGQSVSPTSTNAGGNATFTLSIANLGPLTAGNTVVTDTLPAALVFVSASPAPTTTNANVYTFAVGSLAASAATNITIQVQAPIGGLYTNVAVVSSATNDAASGNNTAAAVLAVNSFPVISAIANVTNNEDIVAGPIALTISDVETAASNLVLTAASSNTNLVTTNRIVFGGNATNRTVTLAPVTNQSGSATITLTVSDGQASANSSFLYVVNPVNDAPTLAAISNRTIFELTTLLVTNAANDVETNNLTFSLGAGAPTNSTINPTNGIFTWTPTEAQGPSTNTVSVIVTDDGVPSMSATQGFTIVVLESNLPPVLAAISNQTIVELTTLTFTNSATDPDIPTNTLTFSLGSGAPTNAVVNATNGVFTWTPTEAQGPATNIIPVIVTDNGSPSLSATQNFTVIVLESNLPPTLAAISNRTIFEMTTLLITNTATDPDLPTNTLTFSLSSGTATNAAINPTNGVFSWTPTETQGPGTNTFSVVVADNGSPSLSVTQAFTVIVLESNLPPVLAAVSNQTIVELSTLIITNTATDPDIPTNTLTFSLGGGAPTNAFINPTNGVFTWTPSEAQGPSTNTIPVIVTDDGSPSLSTTQTLVVTVLESNLSPVLAAISNQTVFELTTLLITNAATDPDLPANILTFSLGSGAPTNATINPTNGIFSWTPAEAQGPGPNTISVIATDNGSPSLSATQSFTVTVLESNLPPVLAGISNQTIFEMTTLLITNIATDPDLPANLLTFSLGSGAPTNAVINPTNGVFSWTPTTSQGPGSNFITIIVTDDGVPSLSATQAFSVTVLESNLPPVLAAISNQTVIELTTLTFTNVATDPDLPANVLTFSLGAGAPTNAVVNPTNGVFTWTPSEAQGPGSNSLSVIVTDNGSPSLSATQTFTVTVLESNLPPVLAAISNQTVVELTTLTITNTATDPDLPANGLTFSLDTGAPANVFINPTNGLLTWTPTEAQGPASNTISVIVTDNGVPSLSATQTFTVTVLESNLPPVLAGISNQTIFELTTLTITNVATDPDLPTNVLTFSLGAGAPTNAVINPATGVFTWTPTEAQGPGTNTISVIATDNGSPSLSATQSFTVFVLESNSPPALAAIADQTIHAGGILSVGNSATDPDVPANTLTFSLDAGHPAGAAINPTNGLVTWATTDADADTTNVFTVRVTDNGIPPLSDARTFTVNVVVRPVILSVTYSTNPALTVTWSSVTGQTYQLQFKDDLAETNWTDESNITAAGPTVSQTVPITGSKRFFRVLVP